MTRVDFYILSAGGNQHRAVFACRLAEKAVGHGMSTYIHTAGPAETSRMDDLLWTYRDGSFLAHLTIEDAERSDPEGRTPVLLGHGESPGNQEGLLINMSTEVPTFFSRFSRVAEIVAGDHDERKTARERFRFYRDRGYQMNTHNL
jgi:DNA polymerase-3 subunit chi